MIWDRIFWLWFLVVSFAGLAILLQETTMQGIAIGMIIIGLGLIKLAEEGSREGPRKISKKILKVLGKE